MSDLESNYDSGADRQAITFFVLFLSLLLFFFFSVMFFLVRKPLKCKSIIFGSVIL